MEKLPNLYSMSKTGKIKMWGVYAENHDTYSSFTKYSGYVDGKLSYSTKDIYEGKNIGKSNETTHFEQAVSEAKSAWQNRVDSGWVLDITSANNVVEAPMKAGNKTSCCKTHQDNLRGKYNLYYIQRKLNGMRCFAKKIDNTTIRYTSIKGRELTTLDHLTPWLLKIMDIGMILDGELYIHGLPLNRIISYVKKKTSNTRQLKFHVYDYAIADMRYSDRKDVLDTLIIDTNGPIVLEDTITVFNVDSFKTLHDEFVTSGYEGAIIRLPDGLYEFNHRSNNVLKIKEFMDDEFEVVGGHEGTGDESGCVVFDFVTADGKPFAARPEGTREQRTDWMRDISRFVGKIMTVRYFELTEYGIPQFPVAICIRDYE